MWQQSDTIFTNLLNVLRVSEFRWVFSEWSTFRCATVDVLIEASEDFDLDKGVRIHPTHAQVDAHNTTVHDRYRAKEMWVFKIQSRDVLINVTRIADNVNIENIVLGDNSVL